jgi:hypothetical protein
MIELQYSPQGQWNQFQAYEWTDANACRLIQLSLIVALHLTHLIKQIRKVCLRLLKKDSTQFHVHAENVGHNKDNDWRPSPLIEQYIEWLLPTCWVSLPMILLSISSWSISTLRTSWLRNSGILYFLTMSLPTDLKFSFLSNPPPLLFLNSSNLFHVTGCS